MKQLEFLGSSRDDARDAGFSPAWHWARSDAGAVRRPAQELQADAYRGAGVYEIRVRDESGVYRTIYVAKFETAVYVLHAFQKKMQRTAKMDIELPKVRYRLIGG
jgi:phage-related protein